MVDDGDVPQLADQRDEQTHAAHQHQKDRATEYLALGAALPSTAAGISFSAIVHPGVSSSGSVSLLCRAFRSALII